METLVAAVTTKPIGYDTTNAQNNTLLKGHFHNLDWMEINRHAV